MWKEQPALFAACVMAAGFSAARLAEWQPAVWAVLAFAAGIPGIVMLLRHRSVPPRTESFSLFIPAFLFFASALWYAIDHEFASDHITRYLALGRPVRIYCRVVDEPVMREGRVQTIVAIQAVASPEGDSTVVEGNGVLTVIADRTKSAQSQPDTLNFSYGDNLAFTAAIDKPQDTRNPGEVSYREYLALNNIHAVMRVRSFKSITVIEKGQGAWIYDALVFPAKHFVARTIHRAASGDEEQYLTGLLVGDWSDISKEIRRAFANTGTVHVLAVSGSHVVVIVAAVYGLFGLLRIPSRAKICVTIAAILFYMLLTGSTPSVVRASLMACVVLAARLFQRRSSVYNCLGISAVLIFMVDPKQLFDVGFQLSFAAVFAMVWCYPKMTSWMSNVPRQRWAARIGVAAVDITAVSAAAQIGTIPFTAFYFEKVSLISLGANLFVVPLAGFNIMLGFVSVIVSILSSWVGSCVTEVNAVLAQLVLAVVKAADRVPYAVVHTPSFGAVETLIYGCAIVMLFNISHPSVFRKLFLALVLCIDCLLVHDAIAETSRLPLRVTFFDVGQGDAALVEFPDGQSLLIDAGARSPVYDAGENVIVPGLRRRGIGTLSAMLLTHVHDDHAGGVRSVYSEIGADRIIMPAGVPGFNIQRLLMPNPTDADFSKDSAACVPVSVMNGHIYSVRRGDTIFINADTRIYVLHPGAESTVNESEDTLDAFNNTSVVLRICYGKISFILMGDAERDVEEELCSRYGDFMNSPVIKLGHHGSSTSSTQMLLQSVSPLHAVISVGRFNVFRHPSPSVIRRLARCGIRAHRTDRDGAVVFETDGTSLTDVRWRTDSPIDGLLR
ncbi:MAG TPA: DNA internalization-related competence protein ComEC/Rec2 [Bacteroidota bacterium]|nr:DNA internalization-related competence protein ComEC/Rec2 [Bacteroidota bacterium]